MTDDQRQRLSALVDGEGCLLDWQRAIDDAIEDATQRGCFERYLLIRRAIRGEPLSVPVRQVAARVAATVAKVSADPTFPNAAPAGSAAGPRPVPQRGIIGFPPVRVAGRARPTAHPAAARPLIGLALAAGFALLAVVVGPRWLLDAGSLAPRFTGNAGVPIGIERWRVGDDGGRGPVARGTDLDQLLVSHRERSAATGLAGFMPYATLVGYSGAR